MKILLAHNFYQQPGGEDRAFADEARMLSAYGHEVLRYCYHNDEIRDMHPIRTAINALWNGKTYRDLRMMLEREAPAICHFHNTFPLMSPAALHAAHDAGVPIVMTLHNYRLVCANALLLRKGRICEDCQGWKIPLPALLHGCYRNDRRASAVTVLLMTSQRHILKSLDLVNVFIALTEFSRNKFVEGGLPADRIQVKPNFVHPDPGFSTKRSGDVLFVGRLSAEKGIGTLLDAWKLVPGDVTLRIAGAGAMGAAVQAASSRDPRIRWLGQLTHDAVIHEMKSARLLVFPSLWYESLGLSLVEAFATGLPVLASDVGTMRQLIDEGRTGFRFPAGDSAALARAIESALAQPAAQVRMSREARTEYESKYTQAANYRRLEEIYEIARAHAASSKPAVAPRPEYLVEEQRTA